MDIGGTFTDVVAYEESTGVYTSGKVPTTPESPALGVLDGVTEIVGALDEISFTVHGTTVGLNAFLQRRGERHVPNRPRHAHPPVRLALPEA